MTACTRGLVAARPHASRPRTAGCPRSPRTAAAANARRARAPVSRSARTAVSLARQRLELDLLDASSARSPVTRSCSAMRRRRCPPCGRWRPRAVVRPARCAAGSAGTATSLGRPTAGRRRRAAAAPRTRAARGRARRTGAGAARRRGSGGGVPGSSGRTRASSASAARVEADAPQRERLRPQPGDHGPERQRALRRVGARLGDNDAAVRAPCAQLLDQPALADPRLAGDEHAAALARPRSRARARVSRARSAARPIRPGAVAHSPAPRLRRPGQQRLIRPRVSPSTAPTPSARSSAAVQA